MTSKTDGFSISRTLAECGLWTATRHLLTYLDLVPPVLSRTLGDELSPSGTIVGSVFRITPVNTQYLQIFFQCVLPCPPWSSDPPPAIVWYPF